MEEKDKQDGDYLLRGQASPEEKAACDPHTPEVLGTVCVKPQRPIGHSRMLSEETYF